MMNHLNILKKISALGVLGLGLFVMVPTSASAVDAPATLHVIVNVINDDGGTAVPSDFTMHLRYLMSEVAGSPFPGASGAGTTFTLPAGSYLLTENDVPLSGGYVTYYGHYSEGGVVDGFVTLTPGQSLTITRTENDWPAAGPAVTQPVGTPISGTPVTSPVVTTTQAGGTLPKTSSPWYNLLAISFGLVLLGSVGFKTRRATR